MVSMMDKSVVRVFRDPAELAEKTALRLIDIAGCAIEERGRFSLVLCGGGTPRQLYELLSSPPWKERIDWRHVLVFWGDERCVPSDHAESNFRLAREALLNSVGIVAENVFRIHGELEPAQAARDYARRLGEPWPRFDSVLLGLGSDGHTASLFPGDPTEGSGKPVMAVQANYGGRPAWRVTMTPFLLNEARNVLFLVSGRGKAEALEGSLGERDLHRWPAQRVVPREGSIEWWVDEAARGGTS